MFAAIYIPDFSLQAVLRAYPDLCGLPVALVDPEITGMPIIQATSPAAKAGVTPGLTSAQATARCGDLIIKTRSHPQEQTATGILLQTAYAFSPNIESTALGGCTMELKRLGLRNQSDMQNYGAKIIQALAPFYLEANVGIAPTPQLALLAARLCSSRRLPRRSGFAKANEEALTNSRPNRPTSLAVEPVQPPMAHSPAPGGDGRGEGDLFAAKARGSDQSVRVFVVHSAKDFAAHLPLAALEPAPDIAAILSRWGLRTAGQLLALSKNAVSERLGPGALELFERLSEDSVRPLKFISPPETFSEQIEFENEVETAGPLIFVLHRFVEQLSQRLKAIYLVAGEFQLRLGLASGGQYEHRFTVPSPTASVEILFRMLQTHLDTVRTDSPIVSLELTARPARQETHQFGLFDNTLRNPNQFAETLARLTALAGRENVGTPVLEATHRPDVFRMKRPDFDAIQHSAGKMQYAGLQLRRFRPPLPAHFEFRENRPALVRSESFRGVVADARGPFLSSGQWWDDHRWAREEWDIEMAGGILIRVFRSNEGCFIEGVYD
jgi:protein ImuB